MDISILTEKEFNEISRRFSELDENKDGEISRKELVDAFQEKKQDIPEKDIEYMFKILDKNQNGTIGFDEFKEFMSLFVYNIELSEPKVIEMFKAFPEGKETDGDDHKSISYEDAKYLWTMISTLSTTFKFEEFKGRKLSREEKRTSMIGRLNKLDKMLPFFDTNNDGRIDAEEFVKIMTPF